MQTEFNWGAPARTSPASPARASPGAGEKAAPSSAVSIPGNSVALTGHLAADDSAASAVAGESVARRLRTAHGLWIDPFTAEYIARSLDRGVERIEFIAADARTGRSAFRTLPQQAMRGD